MIMTSQKLRYIHILMAIGLIYYSIIFCILSTMGNLISEMIINGEKLLHLEVSWTATLTVII